MNNLQSVNGQPHHSPCIRFPLSIPKHLKSTFTKPPKIQSVIRKVWGGCESLDAGSILDLPLASTPACLVMVVVPQ